MFSQAPEIIIYSALDSTMDEARRYLDSHDHEIKKVTIILAHTQNQARGRRQRHWFSPQGNFAASFVMSWPHDLQTLGQMSFVYGIAITEALRRYLLPSSIIHCKWPNDILIDGAKVGGILLETYWPSNSKIPFLIAGVGINVVTAPILVDRQPATTYLQAHTADTVAIPDLLENCLTTLKQWYNCWHAQGFAPIRKTWLEWADAQGKAVTVRLEKQGQAMQGRFIDLDHNGALIFETPNGDLHTLYAGDVFLTVASEKKESTYASCH